MPPAGVLEWVSLDAFTRTVVEQFLSPACSALNRRLFISKLRLTASRHLNTAVPCYTNRMPLSPVTGDIRSTLIVPCCQCLRRQGEVSHARLVEVETQCPSLAKGTRDDAVHDFCTRILTSVQGIQTGIYAMEFLEVSHEVGVEPGSCRADAACAVIEDRHDIAAVLQSEVAENISYEKDKGDRQVERAQRVERALASSGMNRRKETGGQGADGGSRCTPTFNFQGECAVAQHCGRPRSGFWRSQDSDTPVAQHHGRSRVASGDHKILTHQPQLKL